MCADSPTVTGLGTPSTAASAARISVGIAEVDAELNNGLLAQGLHEHYAAAKNDSATAMGFALLLGLLRKRRTGRSLIWVREATATRQGGYPYGPGLASIGMDVGDMTIVLLPDAKAVLRAALEAARDTAVAAVVIELAGRQPLLDLTVTRRFALAAMEKDTLVQIVRSGAKPTPSAAHTRWQVASAPSRTLEAHAPGAPAFALELLRQRGGRDGLRVIMEWDRDNISFRRRDSAASTPPLHRSRSAVVVGREGYSQRSRAA